MKRFEVNYAKHHFIFEFDPLDYTGAGSIQEIITKNDYKLDQFQNKENMIFIDIGAAVGVASIVIAKLNPLSKVIAFEPYPKSYQNILHNAKLNNLKNLTVYNLAVSDKSNQQITLTVCPWMSGANTTNAQNKLFDQIFEIPSFHSAHKNANYKRNDVIQVNTISLDDIIKTNDITEIELLKIDCEGAEYDIIYGSELFKNNMINNLVGEFHELSYAVNKNKSQGLLEYCTKHVKNLVHVSVLQI